MRVAPIVLVLVLAAIPTVEGQLPASCGPIDIPSAPTVPPPIAPGAAVDVVVEVRNSGVTDASITVTGATTTPGWAIESTPAAADVAAGATERFIFSIRASADAAEDGIITFSASGTCPTPLPTCPGTACDAGTANTQVLIPVTPSEGFRIPGLDRLDLPLEMLIAAIVLVGLATAIPFAMRKKRAGVVAECPEPLKMVRAGRGTSFPIEIRNPGKEATTTAFEVGPVPEGWSAFMPLPEVQLAAREARSLWLMVRSPANANVGDAVDVEIHLRDAKRAGPTNVVRVRAEVLGGDEA